MTFGIERLGLVPLRFPLVTGLIIVLVSVAAAFGIPRIQVDDSLSQLFRSDTAEFRQFEALSERFPSSEYDVIVTVEGEELLERDSIERLREIAIDLQFVDSVEGLISMFSARRPPPREGGVPAPLFPAELPTGEEYRELIEDVAANEIIRGKLLSEDGRLTIMVLALDRDAVRGTGLGDVVGEIRSTVDRHLAGTGLSAGFTGTPVMQLEIRNAVERDQLIYNGLGFLAGCLIAALFFGRVAFMVIAAAPPLLAIILALGLLGWLGVRLNMFLNVMTPLIMVMAFSDSMQLTYTARERLRAGESKIQAWREAVLEVGQANVLTSLAVGLSFIALLFSSSHLIRTFGVAGAISAGIAFVSVIVVQPLVALMLLGREGGSADRVGRADAAINALRRFCRGLAGAMMRRATLYSLVSLVVVAGLGYVYATMEPRYRLADQVPDEERVIEASQQLDAQLSGVNPMHILIEIPPDASLYGPETLAVIAEAHSILEEEAGVGNVWSVDSLRQWLAEEAGITDISVLRDYVEILPEHLTRRFVSTGEDAVLVTGRIPDVDARELLPVVDRLDGRLDDLRAQYESYTISVTGLSAIAARNSATMIRNLSIGLAIAMVVACILLGVAFRSASVSAIAIMPGIFPIVISAGVLWVLGEGLQFASVVALTVAFGLGLSSTIHFLNRMRLEQRSDRAIQEAVTGAAVMVGPALILTTLVLVLGLGMTVISDLPSLRLFGWLSGFTLLAALASDLLILPATTVAVHAGVRWTKRRTNRAR